MVGIYKITSPSGRIYIGQSRDINHRVSSYRNLMCKRQPKLLASLQKYGWEAHKHQIIHELPSDVTQETLNQYETFYWESYLNSGFKMLNTREPGSNGKFAKESVEKREQSRRVNGNTARSQETRRKISVANKGKSKAPRTLEHRERLSKALRGRVLGKQKESTKQQRLETRQSRNAGMKKILHVKTNIVYNSRKEAAAAFNWTPENINYYLKKGEFKYL